MTERATAADVIGALERRYNPPSRQREWGTFVEMSDDSQRRRVDFLAAALWISRGRMMHGVEVKVARPDWVKEMRSPKADLWYSVVDRWYLAAPQGVLEDGELPATWGFLELRKEAKGWKLVEKVKAPKLERDGETPWWLVQRMLMRVEDARKAPPVTPDAIRDAKSEGYELGYERGRESVAVNAEQDHTHRNDLLKLRMALGTRSTEEVARAVAILGHPERLRYGGERAAEAFRQAAAQIEAALSDFSEEQ